MHPSELERVTVATVRAALDEAGVRHGRVWVFRRGVVRVDVRGWTGAGRRRASMAVYQALEPKKLSEFWTVHPLCRRYRWRPWLSWVSVRDPGLEWFDDQGRDYLEAQAAAKGPVPRTNDDTGGADLISED